MEMTLMTSRGVVMRTTQLPAHAPATMSCDRGMQRFRGDGVEVNRWQGARACGAGAKKVLVDKAQ